MMRNVALLAATALVAAACEGPKASAPPPQAAVSAAAPRGSIRIGPVARPAGRETPTVQVLNDPFQAHTGYLLRPALEQDIPNTAIPGMTMGRIATD
jgi:hypothetical protein